jgi:SAM-dependent methyltransferase
VGVTEVTEEYLNKVAQYYSAKISQHGATAQGVDWNGEVSQFARFEQLCKLLPLEREVEFSVIDLGCGYAALNDYLSIHYSNYSYCGYDISEDMVIEANRRLENITSANVVCAADISVPADYAIASGIFNVMLETGEDDWLAYMKKTLHSLNHSARNGFAFNCLTSYSDAQMMKDYLFYADPALLFDYCKREFSKNVALLHDYDLYEFTILVRK